jgi:hypothetical protein
MSSVFVTDGISGSSAALAAYLGRNEYTLVFERADGRLRKEIDRPTTEGISGHRSTFLFAERRRSRGPRIHAKWPVVPERGRLGRRVGGPCATRSRVTPLPGRLQAATRDVRNSGPNASSRFVERGGNVTGWEERLAKGLSPEPTGSSRLAIRSHQLRVEGLRGARSAVALASRFDCRGVKKAAQRFLAGH